MFPTIKTMQRITPQDHQPWNPENSICTRHTVLWRTLKTKKGARLAGKKKNELDAIIDYDVGSFPYRLRCGLVLDVMQLKSKASQDSHDNAI